MSDAPPEQSTPGFLARIGNWFKGSPKVDVLDPGTGLANTEARSSILRPWAKRDQAIDNLQNGFSTLTDLMAGIRENLVDQGRRQDELLKYLSHLPQAIQSIPESNRLQGEAIKAIGSRLEQQNEQQRLIAEILNKVHDAGVDQRKSVDDVRERVETMADHERKISDNLSSVGSAMQSVSRNSQTSAQVLEQLRDNISNRDGQMEIIMRKQAARFTILLVISIVLSLVALGLVAFVGYQSMNRPTAAPVAPQQTLNPFAAPSERPHSTAPTVQSGGVG